jgi:serine/threonine-protein kinase
MLVGQQVGPFLVDKELGSGAMGTVYRGRYPKTGQVVAIKVMAPGLGTTNSNAADRFERETKILKQLSHPNIVRIFGIGTTHGTRYFAMEYIDGEPLDRVMARRGRMSWEEIVPLGQQLCGALQHAHEKGIIHRDLKPSNLMITTEGVLKLTDFGIAKDMDVTALTSANCTVGTASYMSPEQCKGERDLTPKSDLYSLGIVLYELLTGRKPFSADNAMEMFLQHVQGTFARPSKLVMDLPVGLDNLVCGLMAKKPEDRPFDAQMVANILGSVRDKVEAQQSAAVEEANKRRGDVTPDRPPPDEADKEAARLLLKGKVRRRRKKPAKGKPQAWIPAAALSLLLLGTVITLYLILRGGPADAHKPGDEAAAAERAEDEDLLKRHRYYRHKMLKVEAQGEDQSQAFLATDDEDRGNLEAARRDWQKLAQEGQPRWQRLAKDRLGELDAAAEARKRLVAHRQEIRDRGKEVPLDDRWEQKAFYALRAELFGDLGRANVRFNELKDEADKVPERRLWYLLAAGEIEALRKRLAENADSEADRIERVKKKYAEALAAFEGAGSHLDAKVTCRDIVALYTEDDNREWRQLVRKAEALIDKIEEADRAPGS